MLGFEVNEELVHKGCEWKGVSWKRVQLLAAWCHVIERGTELECGLLLRVECLCLPILIFPLYPLTWHHPHIQEKGNEVLMKVSPTLCQPTSACF